MQTSPGLDRRTDILKSAAAAFRRHGYHGAGVDAIASALEMTKGNLYYYFRNKEEILYACHEHSLDILLALLHEVQRAPVPPDEQLHRLVLAFVRVIVDELPGTALTVDLRALSPPLLDTLVARRDQFDHGLRGIIQQGIDDGRFAPGDAKMIAFAIVGAITGIATWYDPKGPMSVEKIGTGLADYLIDGLKIRS